MNITFLGLGNMAGALLRGMVKSGRFEADRLGGYDVDVPKAEALAKDCGLSLYDNALQAAEQADVLVLAVKPQGLAELLKEIKPYLKESQLLISIAVGKTLAFYAELLGEQQPFVRAMPSLLAKVGEASSAICANRHVSPEHLATARRIFQSVGSVTELSEPLFPAFSALAATAPAFVFRFVDALASAGVRAGLSRELAYHTACRMTMGSAKMLIQSAEHPRALADQVASPGGTTIEGLHSLDSQGFDHALHLALAAVIDKDKRM